VANLYPLIFEPSLNVRVWGGRELETRLGKHLPTPEPYGESWEIYWKNKIANGAYQGRTLGDLITEFPRAMTGDEHARAEFPLLIKFLDAQDWLSVQVHPDDARALQLEGEPRGKTECWYVIDAKPGAQINYGLAQLTDSEGFRAALAEPGKVKALLQFAEVAPGDFVYVPAGTMHAIGPGLLIYELQQTSDTTYRVYDWDRMGLDGKPRQLHIDKSLAVMNFEVAPEAKVNYDRDEASAILIRNQYFALKKLSGEGAFPLAPMRDAAHLVSVIRGAVTLRGDHDPVHLTVGMSAFIPAALVGETLDLQGEILVAWSTQ
jgi:mannose-6-phosphate isomerase